MLKKGFTLLELVLIIVLLAILAVAAIPKRVDLPAMRIDMAARKVQSDIRYAQSLAISIQKRTRVRFRSAASREDYLVHIENTPGSWAFAVDPLTKENFQVRLAQGEFAGVEIKSRDFNGGRHLYFDKWGNPYGHDENPLGASGGSVTLGGPKDVVIAVERGTGRAYIQ